MQVRNTTDANVKPTVGETMRHLFSIFLPAETLAMTARAFGVFLLVVGTVVGGGLASAQVYAYATPGDMAYPVKIAVERMQLLLAPNEDYRTRLHAEFADRRMDEVARLAELPTNRQASVSEVLDSFDKEVLALQSGLESLRNADPEGIVEVAKLMERKMAAYQNVLAKAGATLPPSAQLALVRSRDLVDGVTINAMAVIVEKHLAGDQDVPRAVVVTKFEDRISQAEAKLGSVNAKDAAKAKVAIAEARQLIKEEKYEAALSKIVEVAQLTKDGDAAAAETSAPASAPAPSDAATNTNSTTPAPTGSSESSGDAVGSGNR